ncbi:globin family protein [Varunaivibrio sulfuroxidans]|uniref:Nitric oxide dioxygenase n=1 Tax=Varunaivibrio sulfuroxidans TaxID=1773489 RepID=A0A4R3J7D4_9PROT|nr:globin family protein [Varunaivibrio sulfuroxidans]TCS61778.1 nitric oxide dioxygenase [Varunaivibrio sulfuroxidans]WES32039.1 globin family protein [Varunaivibrio sulfuroxidans]
MTPAQISHVQSSFASVAPISDQAATLFYGRLFEIAPEVKPLFKGDMREQGAKLMKTLAMVVGGLNRLETILPAVEALAIRHVAYGVEDRHYDAVGSALLWTLEQGLGDAFTPETREAWSIAYTTLADAMISASAKVSA